VIFVDTSVFVYAVGRPHSLRDPARGMLTDSIAADEALVTSAEVLQELLHVYLPVRRHRELDGAWALAHDCTVDIWPIEAAEIALARSLSARHSGLSARDLVHLASCRRREVARIHTLDLSLRSAFEG
jgi:hypothetical protein